ncbi:MAG TPA: DUF885 domain-containing protein [Actinotalea caeni]|uniref:DUF885 domain-containing protein n=1 Tax=Actinotalea caeni TaxID=1348467 RepID=UPI002B4B38EB|nr:DUF885 domain-containing protein [Actinotalea caeni]HLV55403.1 DUF885 domain-containing protein [Actinotalea caeni]
MRACHEMDAREVADIYLRARAAVDPDAAEALGDAPDLRFPDYSPEAFERRHSIDRAALRALGDQPGLLAAVMRERLTSEVELDAVGFTRRLLAPLATPVHLVRQVFDDLPSGTAAERRRIRMHLAAVPDTLAELQRTLLAEAEQGNVVAARQVRVVADQVDRWLAGRFFDGVLDGAAPREAAAATAAFADLSATLRTRLLPLAPTADGVGRDVYSVTAGAFLGEHVDLDELYVFGWDLIARLQERGRALATQIVGEPDMAAAAAHLDADPGGRVAVGGPLVAWLQQRIDLAAGVAHDRIAAMPERTRAVEARLTTAASGVMYYTPADAASTRPGRVWWTVPDGTADVATWREVSTVHHEGVPGHHLQHAITHDLAHLHPWQRYLCHVHGYAEGWAHYAEELAEEVGLLPTPGEQLGLVLARLWRACRIVVDIGLHLDLPIPAGAPGPCADATRWTPELGATVLHEIAGVEPQTARFEVDRYLGWPGQALAFAVGARLWRQARETAERRAGPAFDLRTFHTEALALGPMGLGPLREALRDAVDPEERA